MPDTQSTQDVNTTPSHVTTLTVVAQVVGTLLTAYGALLTAWQATHPTSIWPGIISTISGVLLIACSHFGYVKGQVSSQNALVAGLAAAASSPLVIDLLVGLITKKAAPALVVVPAPPSVPPVASSSAALTAASAPPK